MNSTAFAAVDTLPKKDKSFIDPRATRFGIVPIWAMPTNSRDFYVWEILANKVFPFRPFIGEVVRGANPGPDGRGEVLHINERLPQDQILDMYASNRFFIELDPLARLYNEEKAQAVAAVLVNPNLCEKYPTELGTGCATCWFKDILTDMPQRVASELKDEPELQRAANACIPLIRDGLTRAIEEARRQVDVAIRDIDNPTSGKQVFFEYDYKNVYNIHADRPTYKTSTSNANSMDMLASVISKLGGEREKGPDIEKMIAEAVAKATAELRVELEAKKPVAEIEVQDEETATKKQALIEKLKEKKDK